MQGIFVIIKNGLWTNNQALVALLGLCPLMAVSSTSVNALGLGVATLFVVVFSNTLVSCLRGFIAYELRVPVFVMMIASLVVVAQLLMEAFVYNLFQVLGIFIPLIVTNCMILARSEAFAYKNGVLASFIDGVAMGVGFMLVLLLVGVIREVLSQGTVFSNMNLLLGEWWTYKKGFQLLPSNTNMLVFALPGGAFWVLGVLIAVKNGIQEKARNKAGIKALKTTTTS